ncbi:hypothetical protein L207DRAFT_74971 [Hyaloscypha variabilis F]|uniref:Uncharacterized protein n=1 Tax=Hyaloscypha variabilis (strain UAMH 11265 / GT02V1 / F) TaxID=1149755 RepID=A0A2J6RFU7_HYAVF|nr:hypothetical protein L207DRAFT_74971 [Hyaloscypha variabilis F]
MLRRAQQQHLLRKRRFHREKYPTQRHIILAFLLLPPLLTLPFFRLSHPLPVSFPADEKVQSLTFGLGERVGYPEAFGHGVQAWEGIGVRVGWCCKRGRWRVDGGGEVEN